MASASGSSVSWITISAILIWRRNFAAPAQSFRPKSVTYVSEPDNGDMLGPAEECGAWPGGEAKRSAEFMRSDPILNALDANHDGKLSAAEIRPAARALPVLDTYGHGYLEPHEYVPKYVTGAARAIMAAVDLNRDGWIDPEPRARKCFKAPDAGDRYRTQSCTGLRGGPCRVPRRRY